MTCRDKEMRSENDRMKLAKNADGKEVEAQGTWPGSLGTWMRNVQGASCWKGHCFTDFSREDGDGRLRDRHLLPFLCFIIGDSQAIPLTMQ